MPPVLSTLYTDVASIASLLGSIGMILRTDDDGTLVGSITNASASTPIVITTSAAHGLVTGDVVSITGVNGQTWANGPWVITYLSPTTFSLQQSVLTPNGATFASSPNAQYEAITYPATTWLQQAVNVGTSRVNRFAQPLYDASQLQPSWSVWNWSTIIACHWLCARRNNPIPGSLLNLYLESMDELALVKSQEMVIEDAAYRNEVQPTWSNLRIDRRFNIKQLRVEASITGRVPPQYPRHWDLASQVIGPIELDSLTI